MRPVRLVLCNLHATSRPPLVLPWLLAQCFARRVDAVLLQEATPRHRRWLKRLPRWDLIAAGDEAILVRSTLRGPSRVVRNLRRGWLGRHTGEQHKPRTIPGALLGGWLYVVSVHFPPGWANEDAPTDRRVAGSEYRRRLGLLARDVEDMPAALLGGDWNAHVSALARWRERHYLTHTGYGIDYASHRGLTITARRALGRGPGMDHGAWLFVVEQAR